MKCRLKCHLDAKGVEREEEDDEQKKKGDEEEEEGAEKGGIGEGVR